MKEIKYKRLTKNNEKKKEKKESFMEKNGRLKILLLLIKPYICFIAKRWLCLLTLITHKF